MRVNCTHTHITVQKDSPRISWDLTLFKSPGPKEDVVQGILYIVCGPGVKMELKKGSQKFPGPLMLVYIV